MRLNRLNVLAKGCFAASLAAFFWVAYEVAGRLIPGLQEPETVQTSIQETTEQAPVGHDIRRIISAHLFGMVEQKKDTVDATNAPETKLQLSLAGLISSQNATLSRAMIAVNRGEVKSYRVGQQIEGTDAILHAVQRAGVLLDRGGILERLPMKRDVLASLFGSAGERGVPKSEERRIRPPDAESRPPS